MKSCWHSEPSKRPSIVDICKITIEWNWNTNYKQFEQSEKERLKLIQSMKLGPKFSEKPHSKAIFTSRALGSLIFKSSSINLSLTISTKK